MGVYLDRAEFGTSLYSLVLALVSGAAFLYFSQAFSVRSQAVLERLEQVPEIQKLVAAANENQAKLEQLRSELNSVKAQVEDSARRLYLQTLRKNLEDDITQKMSQIEAISHVSESLGLPSEGAITTEEIDKIERMIGRQEEGYLVFHLFGSTVELDPAIFDINPFNIGSLVRWLIRLRNQKRKRKQVDG